jgi:hypothetical protein
MATTAGVAELAVCQPCSLPIDMSMIMIANGTSALATPGNEDDAKKKETLAIVGDNPKGHLNNRGETRLKPAKNAKHKSTRTPKRVRSITTTLVAPAARQHKHSKRPSSEVRLARGIDTPSGGDRLARGHHAPSGGVRLGRGLNPPLEQSPPRSRAGHPLGWGPLRSRAPTRASPTHFPRTHAHLLPHARTGI